LSRQTEHPEQSGSVPLPELNPLLNPLLGRNMGRWAEAYFTSPPEKRDEAVRELLDRLREEEATKGNGNSEPPNLSTSNPDSTPTILQKEEGISCSACGHGNPPDQRFCGMCGSPLQPDESRPPERPFMFSSYESAPALAEQAFWERREGQAQAADRNHHDERDEHEIADSNEDPNDGFEKERALYGRQADVSKSFPMFEPAAPSFAYSYRVFIGLALALVIGVLAYMGWHSGQSASGLSQQAPPAAQEGTKSPAENPPSTQPLPPGAADKTAAQQPPQTSSQQAASPQTQGKRAEPVSARAASSPPVKPTTRPDTLQNALPAQPGSPSGAEELAMAKHFLNGSNSTTNNAEAADWLWRSVSKQNAEATVLLANLYLRGEGVSKNCEQARILLDAAASKGRADASDLLRHMQAFGCQ
jgi:hypothetical protein